MGWVVAAFIIGALLGAYFHERGVRRHVENGEIVFVGPEHPHFPVIRYLYFSPHMPVHIEQFDLMDEDHEPTDPMEVN